MDDAISTTGTQTASTPFVVRTIESKCKRCYSCIRHCPAKAIRVEKGQAWVIEERCVACGNCVRFCSQGAKQIRDAIEPVTTMLASGTPTIMIIAPSFPIAFSDAEPGQIVAAAKKLGFTEVMEVAYGADLVGAAYRTLIEERAGDGIIIATPCPSVVKYVEKYHPKLIPHLAPIVSPMVALSRYIREEYMPGACVVFAGPCVAKKQECDDQGVTGAPEASLTFAEFRSMLIDKGINMSDLDPEPFTGPTPHTGRIFPVTGGLLKTAALEMDITKDEIVVTEGRERIPEVLESIENGRTRARFFDLLFCEGCINGPIMPSYMSEIERKECVTDYMRKAEALAPATTDVDPAESVAQRLDLLRTFFDENKRLSEPTEEEIAAILRKIGKKEITDELNCGACGYNSCREKAIAVYHGIAENDMCLPFMIDRLTAEYNRKKDFLLMASHQMRSPLVAIQSVLKVLETGTIPQDAIHSLVSQAYTRSEDMLTLVNDILDLSRSDIEHKETPESVDPIREMDAVVSLLRSTAAERNITIEYDHPTSMHPVNIVRKSLNHIFTNLVDNAVKYSRDNTTIYVELALENDMMRLDVIDSGIGIPEKEQVNLFKQFFRANNAKKVRTHGTGLGLSIVKTIVNNHGGTINFDSKENKGTHFIIRMPFEPATIEDEQTDPPEPPSPK